jgi:hypothetical protein
LIFQSQHPLQIGFEVEGSPSFLPAQMLTANIVTGAHSDHNLAVQPESQSFDPSTSEGIFST